MKFFFYYIAFIFCILSCKNPKQSDNYRTEEVPLVAATPKIDYNDISNIKSLIDTISDSHNEFFLGFNFGMSTSDVSKHVNKLKTEITSIRYHNIYKVTYPILGLTVDLAPGYLATIDISHGENVGNGKYFLHPKYNNGRLISMEVYPFEEWNNSSFEYNWLLYRLIGSYDSTDGSLHTSLRDNGVIKKSNSFIGKRNNVIVFEDYLSFTFYDYKSLMNRLLVIYNDKNNIIKKSSEIAI